MVTRRSDELRMDKLEENFNYRKANEPIVVAYAADGSEITATESVSVTGTWDGDNTIYVPYPGTEVEKNPNLDRSLVD